jgi:hypothetical protein
MISIMEGGFPGPVTSKMGSKQNTRRSFGRLASLEDKCKYDDPEANVRLTGRQEGIEEHPVAHC